jgi:hypothetical protein
MPADLKLVRDHFLAAAELPSAEWRAERAKYPAIAPIPLEKK